MICAVKAARRPI